MPQTTDQQKDNHDQQLKNSGNGRVLSNGNVVQAHLDARGDRLKVIVKLNDGVQIDFPVPTSKEIRDRFFYKKAKSSDKPARPPNKFFIFRTMFQGAVDTFKLQVPIVSGIASEIWRKSSVEVKEVFTRLSNIAKTEHGEINPGYVYKPHRKQSQSHDIDKNFDIVSHEKIDVDSSSSPSSSTPSSPCTPTLPLWASTYPSKHPETLPHSNLSTQQQLPHFNLTPPFTINDLSQISDSYPATFIQPQQLTYLSFNDNNIQHFVPQQMLQSRSDSSIDQIPLGSYPDSFQFYHVSPSGSPTYSLTNDVLVDQNCSLRLQPSDYNNDGNGNSIMRSAPLPYSMDYFHPMHHDSSHIIDNPIQSVSQFSQFSPNFNDVIPGSSIISGRQHFNVDEVISRPQDPIQLEPSNVNFSQNIPSQTLQHNNHTLLRDDDFFLDTMNDDAIVIKNLKEEDFN
ncbi:13383_t:CDS:1 [Racocetra fulgida]|uniref:13383_t:CDS:1 n=1 Tax=Racocetra fulgida TaxID=60492 RepID=A0A9N9F7F7_9GLOM|nr:13383_t:CDS:1 [Racocetra fulgida]